MNESQITAYCLVTVAVALIDLHIGRKAFAKRSEIGRFLGLSAIFAALIALFYAASALATTYLQMSVASSIYFISIDWLLLCLLHFVALSTDYHSELSNRRMRRALTLYSIFDSAVLLTNIYSNIAISYASRGGTFAAYAYEMKPLYLAHLSFSYLLAGIVLYLLAHKAATTPHDYRNQYLLQILAIVVVIFINALFLLPLGDSVLSKLDLSVFGYSVGLFIMFWSAFDYRENNMLESLSMTIFQNIDQGIVLFDYSGRLVMYNRRAERLLEGVSMTDGMRVSDFHHACEVREPQSETEDLFAVQCYLASRHNMPLRCDYRRLRNERREVTGTLFVFSDVSNDTDLLTGFQHVDSFRTYVAENPWTFDHPTSVAIFDILGLGEVNRTFGREVGDHRIRNLAKIMREHLPAETYFVRGYEAHLVAICPGHSEDELVPCVDEIRAICGEGIVFGMSSTADSTRERLLASDAESTDTRRLTAAARMNESRNIIQAVEKASRSMQVKKLLSVSSIHSQTLTSLVRALQESDSDTEAHVQRTQRMGALLGERIGLNDAELADLRLLCLLHDIGKIGIPLEILNKPGRLSEAEWKVLRSHAEKGYQIAMSSDELKPIATMILYHHERWDGKGYPEGVAGNNIPLLSRIISVVDSYDAMVNTRSYRKAMPPEDAKAEIERCSGTQFDPFLASEFLAMLTENEELAYGENTGGEVARSTNSFAEPVSDAAMPGSARTVGYSRYLVDIDENIVQVDDAFERITGYSASDVRARGMRQIDLIPVEDQTQYLLLVSAQFSKGSRVYLEHDLLRKDGTVTHVYCYGNRYFDSALKVFRSEIIIFEPALEHAV